MSGWEDKGWNSEGYPTAISVLAFCGFCILLIAVIAKVAG